MDKELFNNLSNEYGEAFYLLDSKQFEENFCELNDAFSKIYPNFNIAYSYKTNYIPKLCKIVNRLGGYAEVVSEMEAELAIKCGVEPRNIIWNGPIKNQAKLKEYILTGVCINIDSLPEAQYISEIAFATDKTLNVGIRLNFEVGDGVTSRFGFDTEGEDLKKALEIIRNTKNIHLLSFQCHFAKRQIDYWPNRAKGMVAVLDKLQIIPDRIDIGGGLFGKMADSLKCQFTSAIPNYTDYANAAAKVFADYFTDKTEKPELVIEPGSALVGDCMKFVGTVKTIKNVRGKYIASVLGSQKNISMTGVNPPIEILPLGESREHYDDIDLVGFTCIEGDVLYKGYKGELSVGDMVVLGNCGSYSVVMKPPFILPNFPILDISHGKTELIKRAETFDDIFHTYCFD